MYPRECQIPPEEQQPIMIRVQVCYTMQRPTITVCHLVLCCVASLTVARAMSTVRLGWRRVSSNADKEIRTNFTTWSCILRPYPKEMEQPLNETDTKFNVCTTGCISSVSSQQWASISPQKSEAFTSALKTPPTVRTSVRITM